MNSKLIVLLVVLVALSGCFYNQSIMPQQMADEAAEKLPDFYDTVIKEEDIAYLENCQFIEDAWCSEEEKQEWHASCEEMEFTEECKKIGLTYFKNALEFWVRMKEEKERKRPVALGIKESRSWYDVMEVGSSFRKVKYDMNGFVKASENTFGYNVLITDGAPLKGMEDETTVIDYFKQLRQEFEERRDVEISDEKCWQAFIIELHKKNSTYKGMLDIFMGIMIIETLPQSQKQEMLKRARIGYDESKVICDNEATKFDRGEAQGNYYQMAYSAGYLEMCNEFLEQFK